MTNTAISASDTDVNNAINGGGGFTALGDGDTCIVPAGTATWTITGGIVVSHSITVIGAGIDVTTITDGVTSPANFPCLIFHPALNAMVRLTGFTFNTLKHTPNGIVNIGIVNAMGAPTVSFRVDHCKFNVTPTTEGGTGGRGLEVSGVWGLIDHCTLTTTDASGGQMITLNPDVNISTVNTWHTPQTWGDENQVYMEDCTFSGAAVNDGAFDMYQGMRATFRHNTVTNTDVGWHGFDSSSRSARSGEIYNNTFSASSLGTNVTNGVVIRGGTARIFNNSFDSGYLLAVAFTINAADNPFVDPGGYYNVRPKASAPSSAWGSTAGGGGPGNIATDYPAATGSTGVDGNTIGPSNNAQGYPLLDQPGRGSFPTTNTGNWPTVTTGYASGDYEVLDPIYQWNNTLHGAANPISGFQGTAFATNYMISGTDYKDNVAAPGYTPYTYPHPLQGVVPSIGHGKKPILGRRRQ